MHVAVIDIGKTNAKVALVDLDRLGEVAVRKVPNVVSTSDLYPHHDIEHLWDFILASLAELNREFRIDAISVTTHGATAVLLDRAGRLALPVLDYEFEAPAADRIGYEEVRPDFRETGSPSLPAGLNIGRQLFWQQRRFPERFADVRAILMYPQYLGFRLTGILANEVTSLGCHTDLWNPASRDFSRLVDRQGWRQFFPPVRSAGDVLGPVLPEIAARTGLDPSTSVHCGLHDSNASLLPHLLSRQAPFSVVSTGTWVVAMAIGAEGTALDPARDTLINVNALGDPVPSARFMGGREYEMLGGASMASCAEADVEAVLAASAMLLPSVQQGCGPFPTSRMEWLGPGLEPAQRTVAISFYLAMMTGACLDLTGARGDTVVEGPFAANELFVDMLAAATGRPVFAQTGLTGTSIGAALLADGTKARILLAGSARSNERTAWKNYVQHWRRAATQPSSLSSVSEG